MKHANSFRQQFISLFLMLSLMLQAGMNYALASYNMALMQAQVSADTLLICTGKSVKLISASHYFETGELVEISNLSAADTPSALTSLNQQPDTLEHDTSPCIFSFVADTHKTILKAALPVVAVDIESDAITSTSIAHTSIECLSQCARSPPFII